MEDSEFEGGNEYPQNPEHLAIAMAFRNPAANYIADSVLRRLPPYGSRKFDWWEYGLADAYTIPNTEVGKFGTVGESRPNAEKRDSSVKNYGHSEPISQEDIDDHAMGTDPLGRATMRLMDLIMLDREVRVAGLVFNPDSYNSTNKDTLSGTDQFDDYDHSDPIKQLKEYMDGMLIRPTKMAIGRLPWSAMSQHPKVVKAVLKNAGDSGVASRQAVADLLEINEIIVGESFYNSAVKGQTMVKSRVWGNHLALIYDNPMADNNGGLTFGFTYQYKNRVVKTFGKPEVGLHGAQKQLVGESVRELIVSKDCGFFVQNVI